MAIFSKRNLYHKLLNKEIINSLKKHFKKYYDKECLFMFDETVVFNREFVKNNPKKTFYTINSD